MQKVIQDFISQYTQWELNRGMPRRKAVKVPQLLKKILEVEIPSRDDSSHVLFRDITNSNTLRLTFNRDEILCYPGTDCLIIGVLYPYWRRGWRDICRDEILYDSISMFFHFASQYIARSRIINVIGAIALTYNRACDFRGHQLEDVSIGKYGFQSLDEVVDYKKIKLNESYRFSQRERILLASLNMLNCLDPYVNRMIFNYIRALDLFEKNFEEEAITALDNTVDVAGQLIRDRLNLTERDQRNVIAKVFKLNETEILLLKRLYSIRCYFGAHPSLSKWWDFSELYEYEFDYYFELVKRIIYKALILENEYRKVEKLPEKWSQWLINNLLILWDAVGFHRLP